MLARTALLFLATLTLGSPTAAGESDWEVDLATALEAAREADKDLLIDFTGSDWCKWCIELKKEVFSREAFLDYARDEYVLVKIDFPKAGGKAHEAISPEQRARNQRYHDELAVANRFPTILLMTPEGVAYARTGYQPGGPPAYERHLESLRNGPGRQAIQRALDLFEGDPDNARGERVAAAHELIRRSTADMRETVLEALREHDKADSQLILANMGMQAFIDDNFRTRELDWPAIRKNALELAETTPSIDGLVAFHMYLAVAYAYTGSPEEMATSKARAEELGMTAMQRAWLRARLQEAGPVSPEQE